MDRWDRMGTWQLYVDSRAGRLVVRMHDRKFRSLWLEFDSTGKLVRQVPSKGMEAALNGRDPEGMTALRLAEGLSDKLWSMASV